MQDGLATTAIILNLGEHHFLACILKRPVIASFSLLMAKTPCDELTVSVLQGQQQFRVQSPENFEKSFYMEAQLMRFGLSGKTAPETTNTVQFTYLLTSRPQLIDFWTMLYHEI